MMITTITVELDGIDLTVNNLSAVNIILGGPSVSAEKEALLATLQPFGRIVRNIECDLHYTEQEAAWQAVREQSATVQQFVTTQSWEMLRAAWSVFDDGPLWCHRLERVREQLFCVSYNRETLGHAIEFGFEVR